MSNWELNEKDLKKIICTKGINNNDAKEILQLINLSKGNKNKLDKLMVLPYDNLSKMKKIYLNKMKKVYETYSEDFMNYIIYLKNTDIFKIESNELNISNNMEEIIDIVLEIYSHYSKKLYFIAKKIFMDKSFLIVNDIEISSYMIYLSSIKRPICVVDKSDYPYTLIHELEHAIEAVLNYYEPKLYIELGSITFETLFIDELVKRKIPNSHLLYSARIQDDYQFSRDIGEYFDALLIAKEKGFNLSNVEFLNILEEVMGVTPKYVLKFLKEELTFNDFDERITYLISHIKSLEIRNKILNDKKLGLVELKKCLKSDEIYVDSESDIKYIKQYIKEIKK